VASSGQKGAPKQAEKLAGLFKENFGKFEGAVEEDVKRAGPR